MTRDDLEPGDVLLSYGQGPISRLVRGIGGGDYSHAALWTGDYIVETNLSRGIILATLEQETKEQQYVDVYRWHTLLPPAPPNHLGDAEYPADSVTAIGTGLTSGQLDFDRLEALLLALIVVLSERIRHPLKRATVRVALSKLGGRIEKGEGNRAKICTETVCEAFWEADKGTRKYAIHVNVDPSRPARLFQGGSRYALLGASQTSSAPEPDDLQRRAAALFSQWVQPQPLAAASPGPSIIVRPAATGPVRAGGDVPAWCVTPHDLQRSPNLELRGRLSNASAKPMSWDWLGILVRILDAFGILKSPGPT